ncbi:1-phosphatidylinositol-3-phosphate 5-kinase FAB1B-like [Neltuma alba]|uniref:1-phosphatidylinositol-3-phosphate 5-kinase FAB1B-like n=1 Tax=Neltuma alba TaxID=207710 RepID=UPI0010A45618|nr:1-phosphatidylinositol-3-phosphate 5-kinase FAB1B-like [Prosopis alba]
MDAQRKTFSEVVSIVKSWISWPSQSEQANVSRVYWMPDKICTVCYGCDCPFTLFNRRHHCRHCGKIFCAHCAANSVPAPSSDQRNRVRVCDFCYKQWEQGLASCNCTNQVPNLDHSFSLSVSSFSSTKSIVTANSSNNTVCSLPVSIGYYQPGQQGMSLHRSSVKVKGLDREILSALRRDLAASLGDSSLNQYEYSMERSGDDEDDYAVYRSASEMTHYSEVSGYYGQADFDGINNIDGSQMHEDLLCNSLEPQYFDMQGFDGSEAPSSLYVSADIDAEPLDFDNNGLLWLPPEPEEDEEYEREMLFDDEDDDYGNDIGEWGYAHSPISSSGSGESSRNRDRSCDEQTTMGTKKVVDEHFKALVAQLLVVENLPVEENDTNSWFEIITSLSWEAATLLKPDTSHGAGMDPTGYVKIKRIACGNRSDSVVVKGVVCKKNVAHRRMKSKVDKPRVLILGGALEYQRVANLLTSVDTLLQQEMEHLKMAVAKIAAQQPDILLVEKSVSRYAQEYLLAQGISLVLNVKMPLLERIARCTGTQIAPSVDHLSSLKLGCCETFRVEKFVEDLGSAGQEGKKPAKTLMFFEGCPVPLGFTILLRGADKEELKKAKHAIKYGVFAAYHLALETSFLSDEGASQSELALNSLIPVPVPEKSPLVARNISSFLIPDSEKSLDPEFGTELQRAKSVLPADPKETLLSYGPYPSMPPGSTTFYPNSMSYYEKPLTGEDINKISLMQGNSVVNSSLEIIDTHPPPSLNDCWTSDKFDHGILTDTPQNSHSQMSRKLRALELSPLEVARSHSKETEAVNEEQLLGEEEEFPQAPSDDDQIILVSMSSRCVWKGTVCERPRIFRIAYYRNFDKPLGRFLRDYLFDQSYQCNFCEMPSEAHVHSYTHRQGNITISVKKLPEILLPGEKDGKIWMWHRCLRCPRMNGFPPATHRIIMSDAAWGLSFGKFLELSFSNHASASRVAGCGHSLHRDCLRFYGFGSMVACFRYASIEIHSVYLPPVKMDFDSGNQEWIQKESDEVVNRAGLLFSEVQNALSQIEDKRTSSTPVNSGLVTPESGHQVAELESMLRREKDEFEAALHKILNQEKRKGQPGVDILEINRLRRQLFFQSYMWDHRLIYAASSANFSNESDLSSSNSDDKGRTMDENLKSGMSMPGVAFSSADCILTGSKLMESPDLQRGEPGSKISQADDIIDQEIDMTGHEKEDHQSDPSNSKLGFGIRRSLSEGHYQSIMPCLSDTLDAKWTGEEVIPKDNMSVALDEFMADSLSTAIQRDHAEDHNVLKNMPKAHDNIMEDSLSWLGMPFINFYRSFNKNLQASGPKFDTLADYNPVYVSSLSSFREMELQGEARLLLPIGVNDTVIPVFDDEPSSIISYALMSPEYHAQLIDEGERTKDGVESMPSLYFPDSANFTSFLSSDETSSDSQKSFFSTDDSLPSFSPLVCTKAMHPRVSFGDDGPHSKVKYSVTVYYAKKFDAMRRIWCPSEIDYVRSLSRCKKWRAQGGKSNVFFAKTLDDRFIIKQVTKTELESFIKFGPAYFKYLTDSIGLPCPTCLAKILGIYQVTVKHPKGGKESKMDVLVMENLLFRKNVIRLYDLKGSSRSRYNSDTTGTNKVLLDQNLIESIPTSPIFVGNKAKKLLSRAVWNDTSFLARVGVMDYSLLLGIDQEHHQLVVGIIDYMRRYTWDKHLETWVKASGILGGPKNAAPTVISPHQYKERFRKAMIAYFYMLPDQWSVPPSNSDFHEDNTQSTSVE